MVYAIVERVVIIEWYSTHTFCHINFNPLGVRHSCVYVHVVWFVILKGHTIYFKLLLRFLNFVLSVVDKFNGIGVFSTNMFSYLVSTSIQLELVASLNLWQKFRFGGKQKGILKIRWNSSSSSGWSTVNPILRAENFLICKAVGWCFGKKCAMEQLVSSLS